MSVANYEYWYPIWNYVWNDGLFTDSKILKWYKWHDIMMYSFIVTLRMRYSCFNNDLNYLD